MTSELTKLISTPLSGIPGAKDIYDELVEAAKADEVPTPTELKSIGRFTVRDWTEWDLEHPYVPKGGSGTAGSTSGGPKESTWGNWTRADPDEVRQGKIDELTTRVNSQNTMLASTNPDRLNAYIAERVDAIKPTTDWQLPNGTVVSITNGIRSSPDQQKQLMDVAEALTTKYPPSEDHPAVTFNILDSKSYTKMAGQSLGATIEGGTQVWIAPKVFAKDADEKQAASVASGFHTPAGEGYSRIQTTMTHEFGHTLDQPGHTPAVRDVMTPKNRADYLPATSRYGQTDSAERYAEAFTEHELSGGKTELPLPKALAGPAGWK